MRSIIEHFGGKSNFPRLRIGIGRPVNKRIPIPKHVLMVSASTPKPLTHLPSLTHSPPRQSQHTSQARNQRASERESSSSKDCHRSTDPFSLSLCQSDFLPLSLLCVCCLVAKRFAKEEQEDITFAVADCVKIVENIMVNGLEKTLSTANQKPKSIA